MNGKIKQIIKRSLNSKGQLCIPAELRSDNIESYMVQENSIDDNGEKVLKLRPITKDETQDNN